MSEREAKKVEKLRYEQAIEQLEQLVEQIESGELGLEEALQQYERGTALIKRCRTILTAAEKRIAELTTTSSGELQVEGEPTSGAEIETEAPLIADVDEQAEDADDPDVPF